jgi:hypothetical protein
MDMHTINYASHVDNCATEQGILKIIKFCLGRIILIEAKTNVITV